jgi:GAF domain-containing protein
VDLARAHRVGDFEAVALGNLGDCALWQRRFALAEQRFDAAEVAVRAYGLAGEEVELARRRAELAALRRDPDAAARAETAVARAAAARVPTEEARARALLAWARAEQRRVDEFAALADQATEALRALGATSDLAVARLAIAEGWSALGREPEARAEAEAVLPYAEEFGRAPLQAWAERSIARLRRAGEGRDHLERLTRLAVGVAKQTDLGQLLNEIATALVELVDAERALVVLLEGGEPIVAARAGQELDRPWSTSVLRRVVSLGREVVVTDLEERGDLRAARSVVALRLRAVHCAPLVLDGVVLGALYLDSREEPVGELRQASALVRAFAAHASIALHNARQTEVIRARAERAQEIAHDLRNPLSGVLLLASDVLEGGAPIGPEDAATVVDAANHAMALLDQTLDAPPEPLVEIELSDAVRRCIAALRLQARARSIALDVEADARGRVRVRVGSCGGRWPTSSRTRSSTGRPAASSR